MGTIDKTLRIIAAVVIIALFFTNVITGVLGIVLLVFAGIFILTSLVSVCPVYTLLGMNTRKKE